MSTALLEAPVQQEAKPEVHPIGDPKEDIHAFLAKYTSTYKQELRGTWTEEPDWPSIPSSQQVTYSLPPPAPMGSSWYSAVQDTSPYLPPPPPSSAWYPPSMYEKRQMQGGYYSFTGEDLASYLDRLGDDDTIGSASHSRECMVAQALRQKYPDAHSIIVGQWGRTTVNGQDVSLPTMVLRAIRVFDSIGESRSSSHNPFPQVTKREFTESWAHSGYAPLTTRRLEEKRELAYV